MILYYIISRFSASPSLHVTFVPSLDVRGTYQMSSVLPYSTARSCVLYANPYLPRHARGLFQYHVAEI